MMDSRAAKLALARKKLKDHQHKKQVTIPNEQISEKTEEKTQFCISLNQNEANQIQIIDYHDEKTNEELSINSKDENLGIAKNQGDTLDVNMAELLICSKRNLEVQVTKLNSKLAELDSKLKQEIYYHNECKQKICHLESELHELNKKYLYTTDQMQLQNNKIEELNITKSLLQDENNNLIEKLEFTKTILTAKETENASLHSQMDQLNRELDVSKLHVQQLLNGANMYTSASHGDPGSTHNEELLRKIDYLEQQLKTVQKERDQINMHYEQYVCELNGQLKLMTLQNEDLSKQIYQLSNRESSLVDQISEMEIRIQNLQVKNLEIQRQPQQQSVDIHAIQEHDIIQKQLEEMTMKYDQLQKAYAEREMKVQELQEAMKTACNHDNISLTKLTADITSDKIAAQRATEQNIKLKTSMQELEEAFVKMSQDKLHLTEKITAEKFLNRELTIKLAECEEKCKDMHIKLMAKDEEMIRLQNNFRDLEKQYTELVKDVKKNIESTADNENDQETHEIDIQNNVKEEEKLMLPDEKNIFNNCNHVHELSCDVTNEITKSNIPQEDAMIKLQDRFLKIMSEVADLADEKHRLEHIILQLQNETDTICEYVALYQQQRILLKKRDDERSAQIKLFQIECDRLKRQLEELSGILIRFAEDKELAMYFQVESRKNDMEKVRSLLFNLKSNSLVDPTRNDLELSNVYPCNCCSGKLIEV